MSFINSIKNMAHTAVNNVGNAVSTVKDNIENAVNTLTDNVESAVNTVKDGFEQLKEEAVNIAYNVGNAAIAAGNVVVDTSKAMGEAVGEGIGKAVKAAGEVINDKSFSDVAHTVLGVASFIPGVGTVAAGLDAGLYAAQGDYLNAGLAAASMIPFGKVATTAGKVLSSAAKATGNLGPAAKAVGNVIGSAAKTAENLGSAAKTAGNAIGPAAKTAGSPSNAVGQAVAAYVSGEAAKEVVGEASKALGAPEWVQTVAGFAAGSVTGKGLHAQFTAAPAL